MWTVRLDGGPRRVNHAAVAIGEEIFSFGGYCSGEQTNEEQAIDVHVLNTENYRWRRLMPRERKMPSLALNNSEYADAITPYQRYGHTVVQYNGEVYLWGGRNDEHGASGTLHEYDPVMNEWSIVECRGRVPPSRDGHSAVVYGDQMIIFGGFEEELQRFSQETYAFTFSNRQWSEVKTTVGLLFNGSNWKIRQGLPPQWRDFHTAVVIGHRMWIFGGRSDQLGQFHSSRDFYCDRLKYLDLNTWTWNEPAVSGERPTGRRSHSAWCCNDRMYLFGGYLGTENIHLDDLYELDPITVRWRRIHPMGAGPSPRRRQCTVLVGHRLFLFGGTMPSKSSKDHVQSGLADLSDLFVLNYAPSLKDLAAVAVLRYELTDSLAYALPATIRRELANMTQPNIITMPRSESTMG